MKERGTNEVVEEEEVVIAKDGEAVDSNIKEKWLA